jgi:hypothetical protein
MANDELSPSSSILGDMSSTSVGLAGSGNVGTASPPSMFETWAWGMANAYKERRQAGPDSPLDRLAGGSVRPTAAARHWCTPSPTNHPPPTRPLFTTPLDGNASHLVRPYVLHPTEHRRQRPPHRAARLAVLAVDAGPKHLHGDESRSEPLDAPSPRPSHVPPLRADDRQTGPGTRGPRPHRPTGFNVYACPDDDRRQRQAGDHGRRPHRAGAAYVCLPPCACTRCGTAR